MANKEDCELLSSRHSTKYSHGHSATVTTCNAPIENQACRKAIVGPGREDLSLPTELITSVRLWVEDC